MATKDLDKVVLTNLVKENTIALTKKTEILNHINNKFDTVIDRYGNFVKNTIDLKRHMKILCGICCAIFASLLVGLIIYVVLN